MLHPITGNRMSGSSLRNIEMMKAMCGFEFYDNVAIATTMWPDTTLYEDTGTLENREAELVSDQRYFGALISRGATVFRHNEKGIKNSTEEIDSGRNIVSHLIQQCEKHVPEVLQLQREITEQRKTLGETGAGIAVARDIHRAKREHEEELRRIEADMKRELEKTNSAYAANLQELKQDIEKQLRKSDREKQALRNSMQDLHHREEKIWEQRIEQMDKQFREQIAIKQEELRDMESSLDEVRRDMAQQTQDLQVKKLVAAEARNYERKIAETRKKLAAREKELRNKEEQVKQARRDAARRQSLHEKERVSSEDMQREIIVQEIRHELAAKEKKLLDMEQSLEKVRRDMARRSKHSHRKARTANDIEKRESNVKNARKEVEQAQDAHKKFSGRKAELYKGALGGVASGVASGVVAGGKLCLVQKNNWTQLLTRYHVSSSGRTCVYSNVIEATYIHVVSLDQNQICSELNVNNILYRKGDLLN
jgi:myosin heavy subunit